jgi:hypothetical protein
MRVSDQLMPFIDLPCTTYDVSRKSGIPHRNVQAQMAALHRRGVVRLIRGVRCHPDLESRSGPYVVGLFERDPAGTVAGRL